jgi:hypothetical protein
VLLGIVTTFAIGPIFVWIRFGVIHILPDTDFVIKMVKGIIFSSFALAVVMWICAEWDVLKKRPTTPVAKTEDK